MASYAYIIADQASKHGQIPHTSGWPWPWVAHSSLWVSWSIKLSVRIRAVSILPDSSSVASSRRPLFARLSFFSANFET